MTKHIIINGDCINVLKKIPDNSVHLVVTSPPYNLGLEYDAYDDNKKWDEYFSFMEEVIKGLKRVLVHGGRICWNVTINLRRIEDKKRVNFMQHFKNIFDKYYMDMGDIIWVEETVTKRTAWGSFCSPSSPYVQMPLECILVYAKDSLKLEGNKTDLTKREFMDWVTGIWKFSNIYQGKETHVAPFPYELPKRCIKLFSWVGNTILDPFAGSGTVLKSARDLNRNSINIEISEKYCERMKQKAGYGQQQLNNDVEYKYFNENDEIKI